MITLLRDFANDLEWWKVIVTRGDRKHDMEDVDISVLPTYLSRKSEDDGWVAYPKSHAEMLDKTYNQSLSIIMKSGF